MMTHTHFEQGLKNLLHRSPFQPFAIEFDDGRRWVVERPETLHYYTGGSATYFWPDGGMDFVDSEAVKQLTELATVNSP